jgi:chromosome segregation ATPase
MNTRPTPETEKLYKLAIYDLPYDTNYRTNYQTWQTVGLLKSHMERFERERDEAREALAAEIKHHTETTAKWNGHHMDLTIAQCDLNKAIRERDEARGQFKRTCEELFDEQQSHLVTLGKLTESGYKLKRERDEAREKLEAERALADRLALQLEPLLIFTWRQLPPTKAELAFYAWEEALQSLTTTEPISK